MPRRDETTHVEPKVFAILLQLLERRNRVVGKKEILDTVWAETWITENSLTKAIARLRHSLADDARDAHFIQTLQKVGCRFIARIEKIGPEISNQQREGTQAAGRAHADDGGL